MNPEQESSTTQPVAWKASFAAATWCFICTALLVLLFAIRLKQPVGIFLSYSLFSPLCASILLFALGCLFPALIPHQRIRGILVFTLPLLHCGLIYTISLIMREKSNPLLENHRLQDFAGVWNTPLLLICLLGMEIMLLSCIGILTATSKYGKAFHE